MTKIKIVKCSIDSYWYRDRLGEIFGVESEVDIEYRVRDKKDGIYGGILKSDCIVIEELKELPKVGEKWRVRTGLKNGTMYNGCTFWREMEKSYIIIDDIVCQQYYRHINGGIYSLEMLDGKYEEPKEDITIEQAKQKFVAYCREIENPFMLPKFSEWCADRGYVFEEQKEEVKKTTDTYEQALKECKSSTVTAQYVKSKQVKEELRNCDNCADSCDSDYNCFIDSVYKKWKPRINVNICSICNREKCNFRTCLIERCEIFEPKPTNEKPKVEKVKKLRLKISVKKLKYLQEIICDKCMMDVEDCGWDCNLSRYIVKEKV